MRTLNNIKIVGFIQIFTYMVFHNAEDFNSFRLVQVEMVGFLSNSKNSIKHCLF